MSTVGYLLPSFLLNARAETLAGAVFWAGIGAGSATLKPRVNNAIHRLICFITCTPYWQREEPVSTFLLPFFSSAFSLARSRRFAFGYDLLAAGIVIKLPCNVRPSINSEAIITLVCHRDIGFSSSLVCIAGNCVRRTEVSRRIGLPWNDGPVLHL